MIGTSHRINLFLIFEKKKSIDKNKKNSGSKINKCRSSKSIPPKSTQKDEHLLYAVNTASAIKENASQFPKTDQYNMFDIFFIGYPQSVDLFLFKK
jgi:hypothetical protein